jgi:hypothetical protein
VAIRCNGGGGEGYGGGSGEIQKEAP